MHKKHNIIDLLLARGFIYQCTNLRVLHHLCQKQISAYIGFDCTAPSLHIGSLVQIMALRLLQRCGHIPIIIIGRGTTKVGDPSGKDKMRKMLTESTITQNFTRIKSTLKKLLLWTVPNKPIILDNNTWLKNLNYLNFLRNFGQYFAIKKMISYDCVRTRLKRTQSLSFLEFNYMLLQAFDFYQLSRHYKCILQIGGSDQWSNIINGVDFIKKTSDQIVYGLTTPLLTTKNGDKMGKTVDGAIWLSKDLLSNYKYWQFWRNVNDINVMKYLYLFTELPEKNIQKYTACTGQKLNDTKKMLANEITKICHGHAPALQAYMTSIAIFNTQTTYICIAYFRINADDFKKKITLFQLITDSKLAKTNSISKKVINNKTIKINDKIIDNPFLIITTSLFCDQIMKVSIGKKKYILFKLTKNKNL